MYAATPEARKSSRSCTGSPVWRAETTTSVGARSSLRADPGFAASATRFSRSSAAGPMTRNRQGFVRWWFGAQRARSSSSSSVAASTGLGAVCLVRPPAVDRGLDLHHRERRQALQRCRVLERRHVARVVAQRRRPHGPAHDLGRARLRQRVDEPTRRARTPCPARGEPRARREFVGGSPPGRSTQ